MDLLIAALAVALGQVVKGISGFGSALVAMPVLTWLWGPREALLVGAICDAVAGFPLVIQAWKTVRPRLVLTMLVPMLAGQALGVELALRLPEDVVTRAVALVVAWFAVNMIRKPVVEGHGEREEEPPETSVRLGAAGASFAGGVLGGWVGTSGPPVIIFMKRHFSPRFFRAQLLAVFFPAAVVLIAQLSVKGIGDQQSWMNAGILSPALIGSALLGARLAPHISRELFGRIVGTLLLGAAVGLWLK